MPGKAVSIRMIGLYRFICMGARILRKSQPLAQMNQIRNVAAVTGQVPAGQTG